MSKRHALPTVTRVHTENGSHIVPELAHPPGSIAALLWHAAVVQHDTGIPVIAWEVAGEPFMVSLQVGRHSLSQMGVDTAWSFLNGVSLGAEIARGRP